MARTRLTLISGCLKPLLEEQILYCYLFIFIFVRWLKYARVEISDNLNCFNSFGRNFHMFFFFFIWLELASGRIFPPSGIMVCCPLVHQSVCHTFLDPAITLKILHIFYET